MERDIKRVELSKKYQKEMRDKPQPCERIFKSYLKNLNFIFQHVIFTNYHEFFIVDFYLPAYKLVIEIDGRHHKENKSYDDYRTKRLKEVGVRKVLRFSNDDIKNMSSDMVKSIIKVNLLA